MKVAQHFSAGFIRKRRIRPVRDIVKVAQHFSAGLAFLLTCPSRRDG